MRPRLWLHPHVGGEAPKKEYDTMTKRTVHYQRDRAARPALTLSRLL